MNVRYGSIATAQLIGGNDRLTANFGQLIVQKSVQDATTKLTKNNEFVAVTVTMISELVELVAEQSAHE